MTLQLHLLGRPQISSDGRDLASKVGAKSLALMAYLAAVSPQHVSRATLANLLWTDRSEEASRYRLRHTLWEVRRSLGRDFLLSDDDACWIGPCEDAHIDVCDFKTGCQSLGLGQRESKPADPQQLSKLVCLYLGDLLEGLAVREAPLFEEWLLAEREKLQLLYLEALWRLARAQVAEGSLPEAAGTLVRLIEADPLRERSYRALIGVHLRVGDRPAARRAYDQCARTLSAELGVAPSPATQLLRKAITGDKTETASAELERAATLLRSGHRQDAWAACAALEAVASDPLIASQASLLRAEIALAEGRHSESLSLVHRARLAIQGLASGWVVAG